MIKAVIFDMDGVILDTESICDRTWNQAAKEMDLSEEDAMRLLSLCRGCNSADTLGILRKFFSLQGCCALYGGKAQNDEKIAADSARNFLARTNELFHVIEEKDGIPLMPGALKALQYLKGKGYRLSLASSTGGNTVRRQLSNAGVIDYFETITTGDMVVHSKPNGEIYKTACASLDLSVNECIAIEDSPNGVRSAAVADLRCVLIPDREKITEDVISLAWKVLMSLDEIAQAVQEEQAT